MSLTDLPSELLRFIVCVEPLALMGPLSLVSKYTHEALMGPDVRDHEEHWRAFVRHRRWPSYQHIEAGKYEHVGKTWRDLARGWRDLKPWCYVHVRNPHWEACQHLITFDACPCGVAHRSAEPIIYKDMFYRISCLPDDKDTRFFVMAVPRINGRWRFFEWNPTRQSIFHTEEDGFVKYTAAAPGHKLNELPRWTSLFVAFI
jgi:hypothetical protein